MASVYKRARDKANRLSSWFIAYSNENGVRRTVKGCLDKAATEAMARKLESEAELRRRGIIDPKADAYLAHGTRPLEEHICDFGAMLEAKESTPKHIHMTTRFVRELARLSGAETIRGLTPEAVQAALVQLRQDGLSARTVKSYLRGVKSFSRWLVKTSRVREDVLAHLSMLNEKTDRRRIRRPLTPEEAARVIQTAETGPLVMGMDGESRAILYALMLAAGLRKSEAGSLTRVVLPRWRPRHGDHSGELQ
jgi:integrase